MPLKKYQAIPRIPSMIFLIAAMITLTAYAIFRLSLKDYLLASIFFITLIPLAVTLVLEIKNYTHVLYKQMTLILVCITITIACYELGYRGLIYVFPTIFIYFFLFNVRIACVFSSIYVMAALICALHAAPLDMVLRFSVSIFDCIIFGAIFAHIIHKQRQELFYLASTDELTGALNRKQLRQYLETSIHTLKHQQMGACLVLIDIDFFKKVNDNFGHLIGDQLLKKFSQHIQSQLRKNDLLFRFGGEEFLVLLTDINQTEANTVAEKLRNSISEQRFLDKTTKITCSIGVADLRADEDPETWLKACDNLLYQAKNNGRNRVVSRP